MPFDASLLVYFRKRLNWKNIAQINDIITGLIVKDEPEKMSDDNDGDSGKATDKTDEDITNKGMMIIDATVTPADIRHPQDLSLLDEARRDTEKIIDILHKTVGGKKPRTYCKKARIQFLETIRKRRKEPKQIHKAIGQQLRFVARNLRSIDSLVQHGQTIAKQRSGGLVALSKAQYKNLLVIHELYRQQLEMYQKHSHKIDARIVSIRQPHVRPIVRGKARSDTEFGAKISIAVINGFVVVDKISFDAYSESNDVEHQAEEYKRRTGYYPERILADKAYQNRANRRWCSERKIRLMGQKQGRPFEIPLINKLYKKIERMEEIERVEVEGRIGIQKRRYGWDCVKGRLPETTKTMILIAVLAANLEQIMRKILFALIRYIICQCITIKNSCSFVRAPMNFEFEAF
jgi:hypothetical protein